MVTRGLVSQWSLGWKSNVTANREPISQWSHARKSNIMANRRPAFSVVT